MHNKIIETINSTILNYEKNNKLNKTWKEPLIEFVSANDEKLKTLKQAVSSEHFMPCDILPDAKSIISFFIPFQDNIVKSNINGAMASEEWVAAYMKTNDLIGIINNEIEMLMDRNGYKTGKIPATHNFDEEKLISNWSHRHIAYIAGLGTFGINNMLITKNGCCGRFGSIIINCELENYRQITETREKCLNKLNGSCGICHKKCIANAYNNNNFNRKLCYKQCLENAERNQQPRPEGTGYVGSAKEMQSGFNTINNRPEGWGIKPLRTNKKTGHADVCGKCLVGLPCSIKEP